MLSHLDNHSLLQKRVFERMGTHEVDSINIDQ
jgi:hypothetical protein